MAWGLFQEVVYTVLVVLHWLPGLSVTSQLLLVLRLSDLPQLPGYVIRSTCDIPPVNSEARFLSLTGRVVSITIPSKYTQSASFRCPQEGCDGSDAFIRLHVAGASEASTIRSDLNCVICGHKLEEDVRYRSLGDKVIVSMSVTPSLRTASSPVPSRHQTIPVVLRDELIRDVLLGGLYTVIGIPVYQLCGSSANINISVEANNIKPASVNAVTTGPCLLSSSVREIYDACGYSPWVFAATLAYGFAAQVCPPGTYHKMKLAMLLSLVCSRAGDVVPLNLDLNASLSVNSCPTQFIDLFVIGEDDVVISRLLRYGSRLAHHSVLHSHQAELTGCAHREDSNQFIDAGSLLLARTGVCIIGDVNLHKKDTRETLQKVLESRLVTTVSGRREAGNMINYTTPLNCTIWSSCTGYCKDINKTFTDQFTLLVDNGSPSLESCEFTDRQMVADIIGGHIGKCQLQDSVEALLSYTDFEQLLAAASHIDVSLSAAAQQLIQSFYLASRRARSSISSAGSDISTTAFTSMCLLAVAHARLSLRAEALMEDAVVAILLYEEALTSKSGYSVLNLLPCPHFRDGNTGAYIGQEYDDSLTQLQHQIIGFSKAHQYPSVFTREE